MNKMELLQGIIEDNIEWFWSEDNIEWFWSNDPMVSYETDMMKLWDAFKVWCVQNCLEVLSYFEESVVEKAVDENYSNWVDKQIF